MKLGNLTFTKLFDLGKELTRNNNYQYNINIDGEVISKNRDFTELCTTDSGLYIFVKDNEVLYIGESKNLRNRLWCHEKLQALALADEYEDVSIHICPNVTTVCPVFGTQTDARLMAEQALIKALSPKLNKQVK